MSLDLGKLITNVSTMGATHFRAQRSARRAAVSDDMPAFTRPEYWEERGGSAPERKACGYCGAPGQRIGSRCEYCQVAVSR